ncbi:MAG: GntR family transcriptional regulator [Bacteroidales bacterium]|nr:GntR family transcriptional regulator [Bacteroidales bacterium]
MFSDTKPIFIQLADKLSDDIISGKFEQDMRIPSVRELAAQYEINVNTAMKSIERLSSDNIIYNKRGMGYYVRQGAKEEIINRRRSDFFNKFLPLLQKNMRELNISFGELQEKLEENI